MLMGPSICATLGGTIGLWRYRGVSPTAIPSCRSVCRGLQYTIYSLSPATSIYDDNIYVYAYDRECATAAAGSLGSPSKAPASIVPQRRRNG